MAWATLGRLTFPWPAPLVMQAHTLTQLCFQRLSVLAVFAPRCLRADHTACNEVSSTISVTDGEAHGMATSTALLESKLSSTAAVAADGLRRTPDLTIAVALRLRLSTVHRLMLCR